LPDPYRGLKTRHFAESLPKSDHIPSPRHFYQTVLHNRWENIHPVNLRIPSFHPPIFQKIQIRPVPLPERSVHSDCVPQTGLSGPMPWPERRAYEAGVTSQRNEIPAVPHDWNFRRIGLRIPGKIDYFLGSFVPVRFAR